MDITFATSPRWVVPLANVHNLLPGPSRSEGRPLLRAAPRRQKREFRTVGAPFYACNQAHASPPSRRRVDMKIVWFNLQRFAATADADSVSVRYSLFDR